jgi:hypothetical protein
MSSCHSVLLSTGTTPNSFCLSSHSPSAGMGANNCFSSRGGGSKNCLKIYISVLYEYIYIFFLLLLLLLLTVVDFYTGTQNASQTRSGINIWQSLYGTRGSVVVKALCCKPEGRGFETRLGECISFNLPNPSGRTRPWGLLSL